MKKITIVCLAAEKDDAIQTMQKQGTLHVTPVRQPASSDLDLALRHQADLAKAIAALEARKPAPDTAPQTDNDPDAAHAALTETLDLLAQQKQDTEALAQATKDLALLYPWGSFDSSLRQSLAEHGIIVELCCAAPKALRQLELPDGAFLVPIRTVAGKQYAAVVSREPLTSIQLPRASVPACTSQTELQLLADNARDRLEEADKRLDSLAATALPALRDLAPALQDATDFARARDGMGDASLLAYIAGYVPETKLDGLLACARRQGWAIRYENVPDDDTDVPTLLDIHPKFAMARSILDFVGILPGYFETDVSISMFIFLSLFCGMLIGDAGYGVLLSAVSWYFLRRATTDAARNGLKVLLTMSLCVFAFGALSGNWFGIPPAKMPIPFCGIPWLAQDETQDHIKLLCFFIGALHTSLAHVWLAWLQRKSVRDVIGNLGWTLFLWANFLAAAKLIAGGIPGTDTLMMAFYGLGFVAILACGINWSNFGDVIYSPFSFINSFVDILSYIRLFAVGLSGVYIASAFNGMAATLWEGRPWLIPVGIVILLLGHLLNIAMAALSILVHGVRLNTLEFSGHIGISWSGKPYRPLSLHSK